MRRRECIRSVCRKHTPSMHMRDCLSSLYREECKHGETEKHMGTFAYPDWNAWFGGHRSFAVATKPCNSTETGTPCVHLQRFHCRMHLSQLCYSARQLGRAIHHRCNSNICVCCSLGRCKDGQRTPTPPDTYRQGYAHVFPARTV